MTGPRLKINPKPLRLPDAGVSRPSLPKPGGAEPAPPDPAPVEAAPFSDYGTLLTAQLPEELRAPPP